MVYKSVQKIFRKCRLKNETNKKSSYLTLCLTDLLILVVSVENRTNGTGAYMRSVYEISLTFTKFGHATGGSGKTIGGSTTDMVKKPGQGIQLEGPLRKKEGMALHR